MIGFQKLYRLFSTRYYSPQELARLLQFEQEQSGGCRHRNCPRQQERPGVVEEIMDIAINAAGERGKTPLYRHLYVQVLVAIAAGILLGHFYPSIGASMQPLGDAFIKLVRMVIAPVIFLTVSTGIAGMADLKKFGRVVGKSLIYFLVFSTLALVVGLLV